MLGSPACSAGISFRSNYAIIGLLPAPDHGLCDITEQYAEEIRHPPGWIEGLHPDPPDHPLPGKRGEGLLHPGAASLEARYLLFSCGLVPDILRAPQPA